MTTRSYSNAKSSRFSTHIRIDPNQKQWVTENMDTKTEAGFLDKIINFYKKHHGEASEGIGEARK